MIKITSPEIFFKKIKKIKITGSFLFENDDSSTIEHYTIPNEQHRIEFEPESFKLADNTDDTSLRLYLRRKPVFKSLIRKTVQELYLKDELVSLNGYLVKLQHICENFYQERAIQVVDVNYRQAIAAGFHPERLESIVETFRHKYSNPIINDIVQPYKLWLDKLYKCVSINKTLKMAKKAIQEFTGIAPKTPPSRKTKIKSSYTLRIDRTAVNIGKLYNFLDEEGWIATMDLSDFKRIFEPDNPADKKVVWKKGFGELQHFVNELQEKFIIKDDAIWATTESLFVHETKGNLSGKVGGAKPIKNSIRLIKLRAMVKDLNKIP